MNGPLRLGVIPTLGPYLMPHLLPEDPQALSPICTCFCAKI